MKSQDIESMSMDELWSFYELVGSVLAPKISAEKARLDERLRRLEELTGSGYLPLCSRTRTRIIKASLEIAGCLFRATHGR